MDLLNFWGFFAGLGVFIFSMKKLEDALKHLAGKSFKGFLKKHTQNPIKAILSGTFCTAVLQSSSIVTLMLLALVGSGILDLRNALGVILGSNLGTTFTGWIVTYLGFKMSFSSFILPLLAIGSFGQAFASRDKRWFYGFKIMFYMALLFWGLETMKESVDSLRKFADVSLIRDFHPIVFMLVAFLFTAVIQSSSASMMITLSALNSDLIPFMGAAAMVIGADLGTTVTAIFGAIGSSANGKRVALAHFSYNLVVDLIALAALYPLVRVVQTLIPDDPLSSLVLFHSFFNLLGIVIFTPFLGPFSKFLENQFTGEEEQEKLRRVREIPLSESDEFFEAINLESETYQKQVLKLLDQSFSTPPQWEVYGDKHDSFISAYEQLKLIEGELLNYLIRYQENTLHKTSRGPQAQIVSDLRLFGIVLKTLKDISHNLEGFTESDHPFVKGLYDRYAQLFQGLVKEIQTINKREDLQKSDYQSQLNEILQYIYQKASQSGLNELEFVSLLNVNHELSSIVKLLKEG